MKEEATLAWARYKRRTCTSFQFLSQFQYGPPGMNTESEPKCLQVVHNRTYRLKLSVLFPQQQHTQCAHHPEG